MIGAAFGSASTSLFVSVVPDIGRTGMRSPMHGCGLEAALAVVGGKWKPIVLWRLAVGAPRFGDLRRLVVGISEKMLIHQLREMEADVPFADFPVRGMVTSKPWAGQ
jgi:HxlR-like helix-turn-helix